MSDFLTKRTDIIRGSVKVCYFGPLLCRGIKWPPAAIYFFLGLSILLSTIFLASANGKLQPVLIVYGHDETDLACQFEPMKIIYFGLEDHGLCSRVAL